VGKANQIREYVTLHRASGEGQSTIIGDGNMIMAYCHAGHDVKIGSHCQLANLVQISGHTVIEDYVTVGGIMGFHQFVTVGKMAMVGAMSRITRDVPPFSIVEGIPAEVRGLNVIGLERRGVSSESRGGLRQAFRLLFRSEHNLSDALEAVRQQIEVADEVQYLCDFMQRTSEGAMGRQLGQR
jgi:UDP-N-acetylglucosamine acyltransferase